MPPKPKFGKAEIINAGLTIAKNEGLDQVTARSIAKTLGSSVCPDRKSTRLNSSH